MQGKLAKPNVGGARADHHRVHGAIDAAHRDIRIGARDAQALYGIAVDQRHPGDHGRLAHEKQHVKPVAFVGPLSPGQLDSPFELAANAGPDTPGCGRPRHSPRRAPAKAQIGPLIAIPSVSKHE